MKGTIQLNQLQQMIRFDNSGNMRYHQQMEDFYLLFEIRATLHIALHNFDNLESHQLHTVYYLVLKEVHIQILAN